MSGKISPSCSVAGDASKGQVSYFTFIEQRWAEFAKPHICTLLAFMRENHIVNDLIDTGLFIQFRRWLEKTFMVSVRHPHTKLVFKSMGEIRREEIRHVLNYRSMIHPFSMFCLYYELFIVIVGLFYFGYILPIDIAYMHIYPTTLWMRFGVDVAMASYIIVNFHLGYWDKEKMEVIMKKRKVSRHYLKTFFIWDLLALVPSFTIILYYLRLPHSYRQITKWFGLLRMLRIFTINRICDMLFREYWRIPLEVYVCIEIVIRTYLIILGCMAIVVFLMQYPYIFKDITLDDDKKVAREGIFYTIESLFGVAYMDISYKVDDALVNIVITVIAYILQIWIMAKLYILWQKFLILSELGEDHYQQLAGYLKYKGLPPNIRQDIYCYYEFRFQKKFYDELAILNMLTDNLKREIPNYRLDKNVEKIKFIRLLPNTLVMQIVARMESGYYCPGDIIFRANTSSKYMYYIKCGTVALHNENQVEICHLEDGSYYGDISVVIPQIHQVSMTAMTPCKVFLLRHRTLMNILNKVPEVKEAVFELSRHLMMTRKNDWFFNRYICMSMANI